MYRMRIANTQRRGLALYAFLYNYAIIILTSCVSVLECGMIAINVTNALSAADSQVMSSNAVLIAVMMMLMLLTMA